MTNQAKKKITAVMIFIFDDRKNILLLKRVDNKMWEPVKGGVNNGESWIDAAARELHEETGFCSKGKIKLLEIVKDQVTLKKKKLEINGHVTYCTIPGEKPIPNISGEKDGEIEHEDFKWVDQHYAESIELFPIIANRMITKAIKAINMYIS